MAVMTGEVDSRTELGRLSGRELEVLGLLATGLNNLGIAEELWLSERTVEAHVARIFDKLGLGRGNRHRRVLAALAYHDLRMPRQSRLGD